MRSLCSAERNLFVRERADGLYHVITYLMSKVLEEILVAALLTAVCSAFVFYGVQLQGQWVIFWWVAQDASKQFLSIVLIIVIVVILIIIIKDHVRQC